MKHKVHPLPKLITERCPKIVAIIPRIGDDLHSSLEHFATPSNPQCFPFSQEKALMSREVTMFGCSRRIPASRPLDQREKRWLDPPSPMSIILPS